MYNVHALFCYFYLSLFNTALIHLPSTPSNIWFGMDNNPNQDKSIKRERIFLAFPFIARRPSNTHPPHTKHSEDKGGGSRVGWSPSNVLDNGKYFVEGFFFRKLHFLHPLIYNRKEKWDLNPFPLVC